MTLMNFLLILSLNRQNVEKSSTQISRPLILLQRLKTRSRAANRCCFIHFSSQLEFRGGADPFHDRCSPVPPPGQVRLHSAQPPSGTPYPPGRSLWYFLFLPVNLLIKYFTASHFSSDGQTVVACSNVAMATHPYP